MPEYEPVKEAIIKGIKQLITIVNAEQRHA
jgi:hypothetical protein